mmetsp:Transcript_52106/g.134372  ORF Transcript_52106/g.134372 Transcript_52106/m.134372 type:complete len:570 (-) Transcript_52106:638-2347(-)
MVAVRLVVSVRASVGGLVVMEPHGVRLGALELLAQVRAGANLGLHLGDLALLLGRDLAQRLLKLAPADLALALGDDLHEDDVDVGGRELGVEEAALLHHVVELAVVEAVALGVVGLERPLRVAPVGLLAHVRGLGGGLLGDLVVPANGGPVRVGARVGGLVVVEAHVVGLRALHRLAQARALGHEVLQVGDAAVLLDRDELQRLPELLEGELALALGADLREDDVGVGALELLADEDVRVLEQLDELLVVEAILILVVLVEDLLDEVPFALLADALHIGVLLLSQAIVAACSRRRVAALGLLVEADVVGLRALVRLALAGPGADLRLHVGDRLALPDADLLERSLELLQLQLALALGDAGEDDVGVVPLELLVEDAAVLQQLGELLAVHAVGAAVLLEDLRALAPVGLLAERLQLCIAVRRALVAPVVGRLPTKVVAVGGVVGVGAGIRGLVVVEAHCISLRAVQNRAVRCGHCATNKLHLHALLLCEELHGSHELVQADATLTPENHLGKQDVNVGSRQGRIDEVAVLAELGEVLPVHVRLTPAVCAEGVLNYTIGGRRPGEGRGWGM